MNFLTNFLTMFQARTFFAVLTVLFPSGWRRSRESAELDACTRGKAGLFRGLHRTPVWLFSIPRRTERLSEGMSVGARRSATAASDTVPFGSSANYASGNVLVSMGDNFAPELLSRTIRNDLPGNSA